VVKNKNYGMETYEKYEERRTGCDRKCRGGEKIGKI
jgi:hypothetical protein